MQDVLNQNLRLFAGRSVGLGRSVAVGRVLSTPKCWSIIDFKIFELNILKWLSDSIIANACLRNFNFEIPLKIDKDIVVEII